MRLLLTQARTRDLAVEAVQSAIQRGLCKPLLALGAFEFDIVPSPANTGRSAGGWHCIYARRADCAREDVQSVMDAFGPLIAALRMSLGYVRRCNRCNERVENVIEWVCPKCQGVEWRVETDEASDE